MFIKSKYSNYQIIKIKWVIRAKVNPTLPEVLQVPEVPQSSTTNLVKTQKKKKAFQSTFA